MKFLKKIVHILANNPYIFAILRKILENNFKGEKEVILKKFILEKGEKILDLGCGTGDFSVLFDKNSYIGIDLNKKYIQFAKKRYNKNFLVMNGENLAFIDQSFDKILVIGVFHHLPDKIAENILKEIKRIIKPSGKILIMEDIPSKSKLNFISKIIHFLDCGSFIREGEYYKALITNYFKIDDTFSIKSGVCDYQVFYI